jgi:5-methylcytosine-specific restriction enzyme subunit McrC
MTLAKIRHLILTEGASPIGYDLTEAEAAALDAAELAVVSRHPRGQLWEVASGTKIGAATVGELQVTVRPKVPIDRLVFMMGFARDPSFWRDQTVLLEVEDDLPSALAEAFRRQAARALEQGVLHGYREQDETVPVLRGRLRSSDQMKRRFGLGLPLEVTYDEFTVDIAENQLLLAATTRLLRMPGVSRGARQALQRLRLQLVDVSHLIAGLPVPSWRASRLNTRYQPALQLAGLILGGDSFEQRVGDLLVSGFVFDMWKIYEDFVCVALAEAFRRHGGASSLQHRVYLDIAEVVKMRPDFVWSRLHEPVVVVDAKYKAEKPAGLPQADLYQVLAYCTVLDLAEGHLVYAKGSDEPAVHHVTGSSVRIHCHSLDLAKSPSLILREVESLAASMAHAVSMPRVPYPVSGHPLQR